MHLLNVSDVMLYDSPLIEKLPIRCNIMNYIDYI